MQKLEPPYSHFVSAAIGWLELGNWREAEAELDSLPPALAQDPEALLVRYDILAHASRWDQASEVASTLAQIQPNEPGSWTKLAYATRRKPGGGIPPAREILTAARQRFPSVALIAYNLACYECQLGNLPQARVFLQEAFKLGHKRELKGMSLHDPDLEPLRAEIAAM